MSNQLPQRTNYLYRFNSFTKKGVCGKKRVISPLALVQIPATPPLAEGVYFGFSENFI
jgi:hypothetical protein